MTDKNHSGHYTRTEVNKCLTGHVVQSASAGLALGIFTDSSPAIGTTIGAGLGYLVGSLWCPDAGEARPHDPSLETKDINNLGDLPSQTFGNKLVGTPLDHAK